VFGNKWWSKRSAAPSLSDEVAGILAGADILRRLTPSGLARFDSELHGRSWTAPSWFQSLWKVHAQHVAPLAKISGAPEATAVILAAHPSGWVREAALPLLEQCSTPLAVGMLVLRSNDWVAPIRVRAQDLLKTLVLGNNAHCLLPVLPLVEQLAAEASRSATFAADILDLMTERLPTDALLAGLVHADRRVRHSSARLLVKMGLPGATLDAALAQNDPLTGAIVAEAAAERDKSPAMTKRLITAKTPRVRRLGLLRVLAEAGAAAEDTARKTLIDRNRYVRGLAQRYLARLGVDVPGHYTSLLDSHPAVAALGLAETGTRDDAARIAVHATHPAARVRDAVCRALAILDAQSHRDLFLSLVRDRSVRVARHAAGAIVCSGATPGELDQLWSLVTTTPAGAAVLSAFALLDRWTQLIYAFRAIASGVGKEAGALMLDRVLSRWNTSFTSPSPERGRELATLLPSVVSSLDPSRAHLLQFTIRTHLEL
jgi:hypothetical protein